jgi:hypothetical protein
MSMLRTTADRASPAQMPPSMVREETSRAVLGDVFDIALGILSESNSDKSRLRKPYTGEAWIITKREMTKKLIEYMFVAYRTVLSVLDLYILIEK